MKRALILAALCQVLAQLATGLAAAPTDDDPAGRVLARVKAARVQAGAAELVRREDLDRVALARARKIAALPHSQRLGLGESIEIGLEQEGVKGYRSASLHLDMVRGYADPASGFLRSWTGYEAAWSKALRPEFDSVGIALHRADDGWVILVAVFLDEIRMPANLRELELSAIQAINRIRVEQEMASLEESTVLTEIARAHSEDMVRRGYFGHQSPEGHRAADRLAARDVTYRAVAENIQKNQGYDDPVATAVESWMKSKGHRTNILTAGFRKTGLGVAMSENGKFYFTQLFLTPRGMPAE